MPSITHGSRSKRRRKRRVRGNGKLGKSAEAWASSVRMTRCIPLAFFVVVTFLVLYSVMVLVSIDSLTTARNDFHYAKHPLVHEHLHVDAALVAQPSADGMEDELEMEARRIRAHIVEMGHKQHSAQQSSDNRSTNEQLDQSKETRVVYLRFEGFIAKRKNRNSLGVFEKFDANVPMADARNYCQQIAADGDCVGFGFSPNAGYQLYTAKSLPFEALSGWALHFRLQLDSGLLADIRNAQLQLDASISQKSGVPLAVVRAAIGKLLTELKEDSNEQFFKPLPSQWTSILLEAETGIGQVVGARNGTQLANSQLRNGSVETEGESGGKLKADSETEVELRLERRRELHRRVAPINAEFADDFGLALSNAELQRRIGAMQTTAWLKPKDALKVYRSGMNASDSQWLSALRGKGVGPNGRRYISYRMNVGRVNNQLFSFEAMVQYAIHYNRTLVIPFPRHRNHVLGFENGLWDLQRLSLAIDWVFDFYLPAHLRGFANGSSVDSMQFGTADANVKCGFNKLVAKGIGKVAAEKCEMVYLKEGEFGIFKFSGGPKDVLRFVLPAPYIRNAVELWLMSALFGGGKLKRGRFVAVHRRAMKEGGKDHSGNPYVCQWPTHGLKGDARFQWLRRDIRQFADDVFADAGLRTAVVAATSELQSADDVSAAIVQVYQHSCAMRLWDLNNVLALHRQAAVGRAMDPPFFVASDSQEPAVVARMTAAGGKLQSPQFASEWTQVGALRAEGSLLQSAEYKQKCAAHYGYCVAAAELRAKEQILFDMWALYYADFLVGTWMSTLTRTVCHWRGFALAMATSNQCFLKWKWAHTLKHKGKDATGKIWLDLSALNRTALFHEPKYSK